jgi:hypothetical protein
MKKKILYIIITILLLLNIFQFVYFYNFSVLKNENEILKMKNNEGNLVMELKKVRAKLDSIQKASLEFDLAHEFKNYTKKYGFTIKRDFDGMTGVTNEIDNNTRFDTWYWDKDSKKFIPYAKTN